MDIITALDAKRLDVINGKPYHLVTNFSLDTRTGEVKANCVLYQNWYNGPKHLASGTYEKCIRAYKQLEEEVGV